MLLEELGYEIYPTIFFFLSVHSFTKTWVDLPIETDFYFFFFFFFLKKKKAQKMRGIVISSGTQNCIFPLTPFSQHMPPLLFWWSLVYYRVLDDLLCIIPPRELWRCKDWLHVRSPQDLPLMVASCWLDIWRGRRERRQGIWSRQGFSEGSLLNGHTHTHTQTTHLPPVLEGIPCGDAGRSRGHQLYSYTAQVPRRACLVFLSVSAGGVSRRCRDPSQPFEPSLRLSVWRSYAWYVTKCESELVIGTSVSCLVVQVDRSHLIYHANNANN